MRKVEAYQDNEGKLYARKEDCLAANQRIDFRRHRSDVETFLDRTIPEYVSIRHPDRKFGRGSHFPKYLVDAFLLLEQRGYKLEKTK